MENSHIATIERSTMNCKPVLWLEPKTVINFKSLFGPKLLCDGLTFSTGTACAYSCSFCYVPSMFARTPYITEMLAKEGLRFDQVTIRRRNPVEVAKKQLIDGKGRRKYLDDKRIIYSSPLVDVAANMDLVRETIEMSQFILENTGWTIRFLSKSNLLPKIAQALDNADPLKNATVTSDFTYKGYRDRVIYGVSTGTLNDDLAKAFEEGTPRVSKRIESLHWLQDNGFRTFGMICPSLPQVDADSYLAFAKAAAEAIRVDRCEHVWAEVMNVRGESLVRTVTALANAGFHREGALLANVQGNSAAWEEYARYTFAAHSMVIPPEKLRFLQYVDRDNIEYWKARQDQGAVLLGKLAHTEAGTPA